MRTVTADAHKIVLGQTGETEALQVLFPVATKWATTYGDGVFQLLVQRPEDVSPYAVPITTDAENVVWNVTNTETARAGSGKAELSYYVGTTLAKSLVWDTLVLPSLSPAPQDPPAPWQSWVDQVLATGAQAGIDAQNAATSADRAEQAAQNAGYMFFAIDDRGHVIYTRTDNVDVDFEIIDGRLVVYA